MKAMILAAGRGERMGSLTDNTPKPLLKIGPKTLIEQNIENLVNAGFNEIVINIAYLGKQIQNYCGNGSQWGASIVYSDEGDIALETAGGIAHALPLLGLDPFIVINADIICDYPLINLHNKKFLSAYLVLINNPAHHPEGDFYIDNLGVLSHQGKEKLTFSGIGIYRASFFENISLGPVKLRPLLNEAILQQKVSGEKYSGLWFDIGTPQRLEEISSLKDKGIF